MPNKVKDFLAALDRLENDALSSRDGYGYSGGDAETIRRVLYENETLKAENEELKAKLDKAKWQPIETAPKDERVLLWTGQEKYCGHWSKNPFTNHEAWIIAEWGNDGDQALLENPTHWMPLPSYPE